MKVTANQIQKDLLNWIRKGNYEIVLPNFYYNRRECDVFKVSNADFTFEYEIKISRADFFADFKKSYGNDNKHELMQKGDTQSANRFFFVVPVNLIAINEIPAYAGLIYYDYKRKRFDQVKGGKLIHKQKVDSQFYKDTCHRLSFRDFELRKKYNNVRNTDTEKQISKLNRELDNITRINRENSNYAHVYKRSSDRMFKILQDFKNNNVVDMSSVDSAIEFYNTHESNLY